MRIFVQDMKGNSHPIEISQNDNILMLRNKLEKIIGIMQNNSRFVFNGEILQNNDTISSYDIQVDNVITYVGEFLAGIL